MDEKSNDAFMKLLSDDSKALEFVQAMLLFGLTNLLEQTFNLEYLNFASTDWNKIVTAVQAKERQTDLSPLLSRAIGSFHMAAMLHSEEALAVCTDKKLPSKEGKKKQRISLSLNNDRETHFLFNGRRRSDEKESDQETG